MASSAASALSNICTSQSGTTVRIFWGQSGCVFGGTMTILKPMPVLLSPLCITSMPLIPQRCCACQGCHFFRLPHWYGARHNADQAQGTVNASTLVQLLLVRDPGAERPGVQ